MVVGLMLCLSPGALADVTLTGNLKTVGTVAVGTRVAVRFELQNCVVSGQNLPRVIGVGILNRSYFDYPVDAAGNIVAADGSAAKIYGNDQITCDTLGNSWYRVWILYERDKQYYGDFDVTGSSFNLNSATPRTAGAGVYSPVAVLTNPAGSQTITQPANSTLNLVQSVTGSGAATALNITPTWNTSGTPIALLVNVTDTASTASSLLMDLKVGGNAKFRVDKSGVLTIVGNALPLTDNTPDLGSASFRFNELFLGGDASAPGFLVTGSGTHSASTRYIDAGGGGGLQYNVPTGTGHVFSINGLGRVTVGGATGLALLLQSVTDADGMAIENTTATNGFRAVLHLAAKNSTPATGNVSIEAISVNATYPDMVFRTNGAGTSVAMGTERLRIKDSGEIQIASNALVSSPAAATFQHGAADGASPVSQIIRAQGSRGGTDSNVAGGALTIYPGIGTGTGGSGNLRLQTAPAGASGSTANTLADRMTFIAKARALTESSPTTFVLINVAPGKAAGGVVDYCVHANDATDFQNRCGVVDFAVVNKAGTMTCSTPNVLGTEATALSAGTLSNTFTLASGANLCGIQANATSSLTQTTLEVRYSVVLHGEGTVSPN